MRFHDTTNPDDLKHAIKYQRHLISITTTDDPRRPSCLLDLATSLKLRFELTSSLDDLCEQMTLRVLAVAFTPISHPFRARRLDSLSHAFHTQFKKPDIEHIIDFAIAASRQAGPHETLDAQFPLFSHLAGLLQDRFLLYRSIDDIDLSIPTWEIALDLVSNDSTSRSIYFSSLARELSHRFNVKISHTEAYAYSLHELGCALRDRFELTGHINDVKKSISTLQNAVKSVSMNTVSGYCTSSRCLRRFSVDSTEAVKRWTYTSRSQRCKR